MRVFKIIRWIMMLMLAVSVGGCGNEGELRLSEGEIYGLRLTLTTRAGDFTLHDDYQTESGIDFSAVRIFAFASDGSLIAVLYKGNDTKYAQLIPGVGGDVGLYVRLDNDKRPADGKIRIVATQEPSSMVSFADPAIFGDMENVRINYPAGGYRPGSGSGNCMPMFGMIEADISAVQATPENKPVFESIGIIWMLRAVAKIEVKAKEASKLSGVSLKGYVDSGYLVPTLDIYTEGGSAETNWKADSKSPRVPEDAEWKRQEIPFISGEAGDYVAYVTEMTETQLNAIDRRLMNVNYEGKRYDILFTSYDTSKHPDATPMKDYANISRNCIYSFDIQGVSMDDVLANVKVRPWKRHNFFEEL